MFFLPWRLGYLYRDKLSEVKAYVIVPVLVASVIVYYLLDGNIYVCLLVSAIMLIFALTKSGKIMENKVTKFISSISMEIYLSHMVIFRAVEKLGLNNRFGNGVPQYLITVVLVLGGTIIFSYIMSRVISITTKSISNKIAERKI